MHYPGAGLRASFPNPSSVIDVLLQPTSSPPSLPQPKAVIASEVGVGPAVPQLSRVCRQGWGEVCGGVGLVVGTPTNPGHAPHSSHSLSRPLSSAVTSSPTNLSHTPTTSTVLAGTRRNVQLSIGVMLLWPTVKSPSLSTVLRRSPSSVGHLDLFKQNQNTRWYFLFFSNLLWLGVSKTKSCWVFCF